MKVLHLSHSCNRGGAETLLLNMCKEAASQRHLLFEVITDLGGVLEPEFQEVLGEHFKKWPRRGLLDFGYVCRLRKYLKKTRVDVLHTHTAGDALYGWLATRGLNIPIVDTHHGYRLSSHWKSRWISRMMLSRVQRTVFVSDCLRKYVNQRIRNLVRYKVVYNGVVSAKYSGNRENVDGFRKQWSVGDGIPLLAMVGNFGNQVRDPMTVCKGLHKAVQRGADFRFLFVGSRNILSPRYYDECIEYCSSAGMLGKQIFFLGSRSDIPLILESLDGFVYSTREDTFGIAVVEAAKAGVPILVNNHPTMIEVLAPFQPTFFESGNGDDLANKIHHWLESLPELRLKANDLAVENVNVYSMPSCLNDYVKVYQDVLKNA